VGKIIYVAVFYNLVMTVFYTGVALPYNTLLAMITRDQHERGVVTAIRMGFGGLSMGATTVMVLVFNAFPDGEQNQTAWTVFNILCTVLLVIPTLITYFSQKERYYENKKEKVAFKAGMKSLLKNKYFILITLFCTLFYTSGALTQSVNAYYSLYILGSLNNMIYLMIATFVPIAVVYPFLPKLMKTFGKQKICLAGLILSVATCFIFLINPYSLPLALAGMLFRNFGLFPTNVTFMASISDTIEYGEWKTGLRTEGLINSAASFGMKVGTGIGGAIVLWTLSAVGFDADLDTQTRASNQGIIALMIIIPAAMYAVMGVLIYFFRLDKVYGNVVSELAERRETGER